MSPGLLANAKSFNNSLEVFYITFCQLPSGPGQRVSCGGGEIVEGIKVLLKGREKESIDIPIEPLVEGTALRNGYEAAGIAARHGSGRSLNVRI